MPLPLPKDLPFPKDQNACGSTNRRYSAAPTVSVNAGLACSQRDGSPAVDHDSSTWGCA
ncbi:MAG TPA: hypothetical protein VJ914_21430 [Pseudonocardiaceae bacterium]|nr:hypothetical protein [Pseudonocardiaceae bacterium]